MDLEIRCRFARPGQFRPDARVRGYQFVAIEPRIVSPNRIDEVVLARGVEVVIDVLHPGHVGAEPRLPRQVDGRVDTEPSSPGDRIDQPLERRLALVGEIVRFRQVLFRYAGLRQSRHRSRDLLRPQAGGVDQVFALHLV